MRKLHLILVMAASLLPCALVQAAPANLPETGQTLCYDVVTNIAATCAGTGQDGELKAGVAASAPRFVVGTGVGTTDQCVTDSLTGLMWVRSPSTTPDTWANALASVNAMNVPGLCGFMDWRLPNRKELRSLINYGQADNVDTLNTLGFINLPKYSYWSSSSYQVSTIAWVINMVDGTTFANGSALKTQNFYIWPVRAGQ